MKFSCNREKLVKSLHIAQKATDSKSTIAVLRNVLFDISGDKLSLSGYDGRMGIRTGIECAVEEEGRIAVPCALLLEVLGVVSEEKVFFTLDSHVMKLECGKSSYNFNCIPADDFPPFPKIEGKDTLDMDGKTLDTGIRQTIFSTNPSDIRQFMGGVLFHFDKEKNEIRFVATDGHRLAMRLFNLEGQSIPARQVIVPSRVLQELIRILPETDAASKVNVAIDDKSISFTTENFYVVSRLVEAEYPKYEKVIPAMSEGSCRVNRVRMQSAVRGAAIMARSKENRDLIEINVTDESIKFSSSTQDIGSANEEVEISKKGKDIRVAFNSKYITDFLNVVDDDEVVFEFTDELAPGLFHADLPDYKYVLMPIRV